MTRLSELVLLVAQYRTGLEAQMRLLRRVESVAAEQRDVTRAGEFHKLPPLVEERDRLMATIVSIEHGLKPVRGRLGRATSQLSGVVEFQQVVKLHREAARLASSILSADEVTAEALKEAEVARRAAAQALEQGEHTLAAYRRVTVPLPSPATLVDRRG